MRAVIFANGPIDDLSSVRYRLLADDYFIAADGGALHIESLGFSPSVVIGDLDSIPGSIIKKNSDVEIVRHSPRKDQTDLELAIFLAMQRGANKALIFGALGKRWDMTIANVYLGALPEFKDIDVRIIDGNQEIRILREKEIHCFFGQKGDIFSLIPISTNVHGITSEGLEYPLKNDLIRFGSTRGISNAFSKKEASVRFKRGLLMCITGAGRFP